MQTMLSTATPHQTSARRSVTVRAMKSLMRMSKRPFNTNLREDANVRAAYVEPSPAVASAVLSGKHSSEPKHKSLAAVDVLQGLLIGLAKELIAQPEPAAQLLRRLCCRTRPTLACEVCIKFRKPRVLSEG